MSHPDRYVRASSDGAILVTIPLRRGGWSACKSSGEGYQKQQVVTPRIRGEYRPVKGPRAAQEEKVIEEEVMPIPVVQPRRAPAVYKPAKGSFAAQQQRHQTWGNDEEEEDG